MKSLTTTQYLLRATFTQGERAAAAWTQWKSSVDLSGHVDRESYRLFPQLSRNATALGIKDPLIGRFNGVWRHTWSRNQLLVERVAPLLGEFSRANTRFILVGEAALLLLSGSEYGLYPIDEFSILVYPADRIQALEQLHKSGWRSSSGENQQEDELLENSLFVDEGGNSLRVNWRLLPEYIGPGGDEDIWAGALPATVRGVAIQSQNSEDQLLGICANGMQAKDASFFARVGDAMTLLNAFDWELDWDRLLYQAKKRRLKLAVLNVLDYLQYDLDAPIPQWFLSQLRAQSHSPYEWIEQRLIGSNMTPISKMSRLWFRYLRLTDDSPFYQSLRQFPGYLQQRWHLEHARQIPAYAVGRALSSMCKRDH